MRPVYVSTSMLLRNAQRNNSGVKTLYSFDAISKTDKRLSEMSFVSDLANDATLSARYANVTENNKPVLELLQDTLEHCKKASSLVISETASKLTGLVRKEYHLVFPDGTKLPVRLWNNKESVPAQEIKGEDFKKITFGFAMQDGDIVRNDAKLDRETGVLVSTPRIFANILAIQKA